MVTQYGMGTELQSKQLPAEDYSMSDATRRMIDEEQQYLTDLAHRRATKIVSEHRELLEELAFTLLENEALEREDIDRIVSAYRGGGNGKVPAADGEPRGGEPRIAASERLPDQEERPE
jgi:ATP-dependent Zn protease